MRRRAFITLVCGAAVAWPLSTRAQRSDGMRTVGMLANSDERNPRVQSEVLAFQSALAKLGWTRGSNLRIELRWGANDPDRIRTLAKELVGLRPDAIFGFSTPVINALARETRTIPIVFASVSDPIGSGFAASLAHPGGNITGYTFVESALGGKWVELLKGIAPRTERVALLYNPATSPPLKFWMPSIQAAASSFSIQVSTAPIQANDEIEGVVAEQTRNPGGGLIVMPDIFNTTNSDLIIALAARFGVATIYFDRHFAEAGGLIAYGTDLVELFRRAAG